jgi:hypothetical protein
MAKLNCNIENMTKLVEALESGEYTQAQQMLRVGKRYCCLGVACDLAGKAGLGEWKSVYGDWRFEHIDGSKSTKVLPTGVRQWLGVQHSQLELSDWTADLDWDKSRLSGSTLNDGGSTFAQIAAKIREVYL